MDFDGKVGGLKELDDALARLDGVTQFRVVRRASMFAMLPVMKKAKALAPVGDYDGDRQGGLLRDSITRVTKRPRGLEKRMSVSVGPKKRRTRDPWYWRFVEFGTRYADARPFLRPALESQYMVVLDRFAKQLRKAIERVTRG